VARALRDAGLTAAPQDPGHVLWRLLPGETVVVDALAAHGWPKMYPPLADVVARGASRPDGLTVAAPADRLTIHAAEAVAGWPIDKVVQKVRPALDEASLDTSAQTGPLRHLAALVENPDRLAATARAGRLPLRAALAAGVRSGPGRAALRARAAARLGLPARPPLPAVTRDGRNPPRGFVVALSGMDGAGKSTAALELAATFEELGRPVVVFWTRLTGDPHLLDLVARPVRRLLGRARGTAASGATPPSADLGGTDAAPVGEMPPRSGRGRLIDAAWIVLVALDSVRVARRAFRLRRRGLSVICDRWTADALVDLRLRYGRHLVAEWLLKRGMPPADLALYLDVDAATAAARKPGDQPIAVLEAMAGLYGRHVRGQEVIHIDARAERPVVAEQANGVLRAALATSRD
jgi:thymidylate kinase